MKIKFTIRQFVTKSVSILGLCVALSLQLGCQNPARSSDLKISGEFQTFAVSMLSPQGAPYDRAAISQLAPVAADAVVSSMTAKGYREAPIDTADLVVRLSGKFAPDFKAEFSKMTGDLTPNVTPESAQHRVLAIDVVDSRTQTTLWADSRTASGNTTLPPERLRAIITEMLRPFPSATPSITK